MLYKPESSPKNYTLDVVSLSGQECSEVLGEHRLKDTYQLSRMLFETFSNKKYYKKAL